MRIAKNAMLLALPVWGLLVSLWLISLVPGAAGFPGEGLIFLGGLLLIVGGSPIYTSPSLGITSKSLLFVAYCAVCGTAMFVGGWGALGVFGISKSP